MPEIVSPLTNTSNVILEKQINVQTIIKKYNDKFGIDTSYIFKDLNYVSVYRCIDSGYRFYYPFNLAGDDNFYKHFGKYDWYYLPWKWEHAECVRYIKDNDKVLEVGAAKGDFLQRAMRLRNVECVGLELNSDAVKEANAKGIKLINQSIEEHALANPSTYDVVCSFQVLEHISNVREVIQSMVACLKPGGILVISVPNNDSFIKDNQLPSQILNMPPHHMGLWSEESLRNLCDIFPLVSRIIKIEPLQPIHADTYQYGMVRRILFGSDLLVRIYWKLKIYLLGRLFLKLFARHIKGHSIISIYTKVE